jgi:hypothetical protein
VRIPVEVRGAAGVPARAWSYLSSRIDPGLRPARWYLEAVLAGAREQRLPAAWIAALAEVRTRP